MTMPTEDATCETAADPARSWISAGRDGSATARGKLFERYREYLLLFAERKLDSGLQSKIDASDLVQQTFLDAERGFGAFRGENEQELLAWLRRILQNQAGQAVRCYFRAAKRDIRLERSLAGYRGAEGALPIAEDVETPSRQLAAAEEAKALAVALARLPAHYRQVIEWRNTERKRFDEIGDLLNRSPEAARKLWVRAIERLRAELGIVPEPRTTA